MLNTMSSFKFNFSENSIEKDDDKDTKTNNDATNDDFVKLPFREIVMDENIIQNVDNLISQHKLFTYGNSEIKYVAPEDALQFLIQEKEEDVNLENISLAEKLHSDLIEGKYEGGFKIWECTTDLANYINDNGLENIKNSTVLDLGCGAGILGIAALKCDATVHFQDYNEEVLVGASIPNILLNFPIDERSEIKNKCRFFAGDWSCLYEEMEKEPNIFQYDYILTSETIYNIKNYSTIYNLIKNRLKKTGYALIAAKSHYFGVGGSSKQFEEYVKADGAMKCEVCWKSEEGLSREIIKLHF